jgi:hypothetical protein
MIFNPWMLLGAIGIAVALWGHGFYIGGNHAERQTLKSQVDAAQQYQVRSNANLLRETDNNIAAAEKLRAGERDKYIERLRGLSIKPIPTDELSTFVAADIATDFRACRASNQTLRERIEADQQRITAGVDLAAALRFASVACADGVKEAGALSAQSD